MPDDSQGPDGPQDTEKKIFVDEDWKSKVQAEKEATSKEQPPATEGDAEAPAADSPAADSSAADPTAAGPMPAPTLTFLASSLYLQAMISLGTLPSPGADKPQTNLAQAKHMVDLIQMLQEKTEGNRTDEESKEFEQILHELRMTYVSVQQQGQ